MAKTSGELEKEFIDTAKEKTGKSLEEWLVLLKSSGIGKRNELMAWLKTGHQMNHMQAQFVAGIFLNNGNPFYTDEGGLLESQFAKCTEMRPLFDAISEKILSGFKGTQMIPKKTYLSFTAIREFAAANIKPGAIRLGMDLGDMPLIIPFRNQSLQGQCHAFRIWSS